MKNSDLDEGIEVSSLQGRLPFLTKKMRKMCVQLHKINPASDLTEDLDYFTGKNQTNPHRESRCHSLIWITCCGWLIGIENY